MAKAKSKLAEPNWKDPAFLARVSELVSEGCLLKGIANLVSTLNETRFGGEKPWRKIRQTELSSQLDGILWTKDRLHLLRDHVGLGVDLSRVYDRWSFIPKKIIDAKVRQLRGKSWRQKLPELSMPGIGRLATDQDIEKGRQIALEVYTGKNPFVIPVADPDKPRVYVVNGAHLGLEYNRVLAENFLRNVLLRAEAEKFDAILFTGGLMWLDVSKAQGFLTTHRALFSGLDFDPDVLDPDYQKKAKEVRRRESPNAITFSTLRERVKNVLGGYRKVTTDPDTGKPLFSGKIYICFGRPEEQVIESSAHDHIRYVSILMRSRLEADRKALQATLRYELLESGGVETKSILKLRKEIEALIREEKRMVQTNVDAVDRRRFVNIIRSLLISWYQEVIPNAHFITQGSTVLSIGGKIVSVAQVEAEASSEQLIDGAMRGASTQALSGKLPDLVLLAGAYNVDAREGIVERVVGKERKTTRVWTLPVAIDKTYLLRARPELIREASPIERLLGNDSFEPGVFRLGCVNGIWDCASLSPDIFFPSKPNGKSESHSIEKQSPYMFWLADGDYHHGAPAKEWIFDPISSEYLPLEVAVATLFMREFVEKGKKLPFIGWHCGGDILQGRHFPTHQARNPGTLPYSRVRERMRELREHSGETRRVNEATHLVEQQFQMRGEVWMQYQLEEAIRLSIRPRVSFFMEILKRAKELGIRMRGTSEILRGSSDMATIDMGILNLLGGNHAEKTTFGEILEGPVLAWMTRLYLLAAGGFDEKELERLVRGPVFGPENIGYGLLSAPGGYEWAFHVRHDPPVKGSQNAWTLQGVAERYRDRGDYPRIFTGRHLIGVSHDIHRAGMLYGPNMEVVSVPSCTDGDAFGERFGMSRNNIGATVIGIPVFGPESGPVRVIQLTHDFIRGYFTKPWEIDWDELFRGAIK